LMMAVKTTKGYRLNGDVVSLREALILVEMTGGYLQARAPGVWEVVVDA